MSAHQALVGTLIVKGIPEDEAVRIADKYLAMAADERSEGPELVRGRVSEYRFVYWQTDTEPARYYAVRRDLDHRSDRWGVFDGEIWAWHGDGWGHSSVHPESYKWSREDALEIAERLTVQKNQQIIKRMDDQYPGKFRGGPYDMVAQPR
ncbi:hypothetical protein PV336_16305 [Streptomyces sp. MI02-2A]|uniref:hypothetical protein n=1 Tax=Streptomyces sp. MI02-2A TaxID=3028688 RepID=UPI0029A38E7C|nr:hypothetical protein [Streptomyces sp. MI02-2A]MDX3260784.1 hypothetical protein [Streptomyces sp. MI02-2A]